MSNRSKGARLWLRKSPGRQAVWVIRDGGKCVSTRCGARESAAAEKALSDYLANKYEPPRDRGRDPDNILLADVLSIYSDDAKTARPKELGQRIDKLLDFFGDKPLSAINGKLCRDYAKQRPPVAGRREMEDLRAAINHHRREGMCSAVVEVVLPQKPPPRARWLTRDEAAKLIRAAWRYREHQHGTDTVRKTRQHIARFILVGLYTGTRSGAICAASFAPAEGRSHLDLLTGLFTRLTQGARKTKKRQPSIQIPRRLLTHIRRWRRIGVARKAVVEFNGKPVTSIKKAFSRVALSAGMHDVTPHTLRHTAISWAVQRGVNLHHASEFFGASIEMIREVYGHLAPAHLADVAEALTRHGTGSAQVGENKQR